MGDCGLPPTVFRSIRLWGLRRSRIDSATMARNAFSDTSSQGDALPLMTAPFRNCLAASSRAPVHDEAEIETVFE